MNETIWVINDISVMSGQIVVRFRKNNFNSKLLTQFPENN